MTGGLGWVAGIRMARIGEWLTFAASPYKLLVWWRLGQGYACLLITAAALNEMRTAFAKCAAKLHGPNKVVADECPEHLHRMRTFDYFDQTVVQPDFQDPLVFVSALTWSAWPSSVSLQHPQSVQKNVYSYLFEWWNWILFSNRNPSTLRGLSPKPGTFTSRVSWRRLGETCTSDVCVTFEVFVCFCYTPRRLHIWHL